MWVWGGWGQIGTLSTCLCDDGNEQSSDEEEEKLLDEPRAPESRRLEAHHLHRLPQSCLLLQHKLLRRGERGGEERGREGRSSDRK